jgi:hypothetical protein
MARSRSKFQSANPDLFLGCSLLTLFVEVDGLDHLNSEDLGRLALVSQEFDAAVRENVSLELIKLLLDPANSTPA